MGKRESPPQIVTEEATTASTASVCSDEVYEEPTQMPGTPQSMSGFDEAQNIQGNFDVGSKLQTSEPKADPTSPNVEQMHMMLGQPLMSPMCTTVVLGLPAPAPSPAGNMVCMNVPPMASSPIMAQGQQIQSFYRVAFAGGIDIRSGPSVNAPKTGMTLPQNEIFSVIETVGGPTPDDPRLYLKLADGRGWVFDDRALYPADPSVVRGRWEPQQVAPPPPQQFVPSQQFAPAPVMGMPQVPAGYAMPPVQYPYQGQPLDCGLPCYPLYAEQGQMPLPPTQHPECSQVYYPPDSTELVPRKWKRGKRGGAKRRPKTAGMTDAPSVEVAPQQA